MAIDVCLCPAAGSGGLGDIPHVQQGMVAVVGAVVRRCAVLLATGDYGRVGLLAVNGLSNASLNLFLLWLFGRTLLPGREPLISQISRHINGQLRAGSRPLHTLCDHSLVHLLWSLKLLFRCLCTPLRRVPRGRFSSMY